MKTQYQSFEKVAFVRRSSISKKENTIVVEIDPRQLERWENNEILIQDAFPHLTATEREFILTGFTAAEQDEVFG